MKNNLILFIILLLISCGGGSSGTGSSYSSESSKKLIEGLIENQESKPLSDVEISILETGDTTKSDQNGKFSIIPSTDSSSLSIEFKYKSLTDVYELNNLDQDESTIKLNTEINENSGTITTEKIEVTAKMIGDCDKYFVNKRSIIQDKTVPANTSCTIELETKSNGSPKPNVPFSLTARECSELSTKPPHDISQGETSIVTENGISRAIARINFNFEDSKSKCVYSLYTQSDVSDFLPFIEYKIITKTKQKFDEQNIPKDLNFEIRFSDECKDILSLGDPILQTGDVYNNTLGILCEVFINEKDNKKITSGVLSKVEVTGCSGRSPYRTIIDGIVFYDDFSQATYGSMFFPLLDNNQNCIYKITVPADTNSSIKKQEFYIHTKTKQEYDKNK